MNKLETALQYAEDIRSGRISTNRLIKLAIERHFRDMEDAERGGPYYFCEASAQKALRFFDLLVLTKDITAADVPPDRVNPDGTVRFHLEPWQGFLVASIFGWKRRETGYRKYKEAYVEIPKKSGKTTLAAGIANYMLIADNVAGPEVFLGAHTRDQAGICFREAKAQVSGSRYLKNKVTVLNYSVSIPKRRAVMMAISNDAGSNEGRNSHCAIIDEYHVHTTSKLKDSAKSGQVSRKQSLLFIITTAGYNKQGPCYKHREIVVGMLEGKYPLNSVFSLIYGIDEEDDWKDEATWHKASPSLGVTVQLDNLRDEFQLALRSGSAEVEFRTKYLNQWVDAAVTWIPSELWNKQARPFNPPQGAICYGGLDLASISDVTAFSLYFPEHNFLQRYLYVPEEAAKTAARGGIDYSDWVRDGYLIATLGKTTDYRYLMEEIMRVADYYDLQFIGYDRYNSSHLVQDLNDQISPRWVNGKDGKPGKYEPVMQPFGQGFISMSTPTKEYEKLLLDEVLLHDGNPVMAWMIGNVALRRDAADNIKVDKGESKDKIDGVVADIMALGEYLAWNWNQTTSDWVGVL